MKPQKIIYRHYEEMTSNMKKPPHRYIKEMWWKRQSALSRTIIKLLWWMLIAHPHCIAEGMLNMMGPTNIAPTVSAYVYMCGQHNFNKMPLAPMGFAVLLHNKPDIQKTWSTHAINGFYIETSQKHYML